MADHQWGFPQLSDLLIHDKSSAYFKDCSKSMNICDQGLAVATCVHLRLFLRKLDCTCLGEIQSKNRQLMIEIVSECH